MKFKDLTIHKVPEQSPGFLLWHISTSWRSNIEGILKPLGITHPQFVILASLGWLTKDGEKVSQAAVGKMAGLDPNTTSQILKGLEEKRLISRKSSTDARAKNPLLTALGKKVISKALPAVESADRQFFQNLSKSEIKELICTFQKLVSNKKAQIQPALHTCE